MKKKLFFLTASLMLTCGLTYAQVNSPTMYKGSSVNPGTSGSYYGTNATATGYHSFAGGRFVNATGSYSMANGLYSDATGAYSYAFGVRTYATNSHAMSFGIDVRATGNRSITIGSGVGNGVSNALVNNIDRSLMVGFNSTVPTLFVGSSSGGTTTGNVGIGNSAPSAKLHVTGDARVTERMGVGAAPISGTVLNLFSNTDRTIYALSGNWNAGVGAEIRGGSRGVFGIAGATFTSGTQPTETYGVWGIGVLGSSLSCGVHGDGTGEPAGYAYGVWGTAIAGGIASYGVYGNGSGGFGPFYAGYFDGDVYTTGMYMSSDERLKENVDDLKVADKLMMLQPKEYTYKTQDFERMNLPEGTQMGFIAQELEEVFPELVKETVQPPKVDEDGKIIEEGITFKTVNYVGLIPALTATVQEQQKTIEELKARIDMLEEGGNSSPGLDIEKAELFQNTPNPFNTRTTIRYSLPESIQTASILIFDMNGALKETLQAEVSESGRVELSANQLQPGMYIYTLVADGKEVDSKRMIISNH